MKLKTAVHISGCIPVYFKPVAIDSLWNTVPIKNNTNNFDLYVDGGMINNYPINMFDSCISGSDPFTCEDVQYNNKTLGLKLERPEQIQQLNKGNSDIAPHSVFSLNDYKLALINLMQETLQRKTSTLQNEKGRTIYISYGNTFGKIRKVGAAEKKELFNNGVKAAEEFFYKEII
jgi:NTE family protein